jgi:hypothetical protein
MDSNNYHVYSKDLINAGCSGIFTRKGRYGGTYCAPDWAIHFANWIDPVFYVETIKAYRLFTEHFYGKDAQLKRFTRELAAENFKLISGTALKALPESADVLFEKRIASVEADILNLALWGMTAQEWRIKHPLKRTRAKTCAISPPPRSSKQCPRYRCLARRCMRMILLRRKIEPANPKSGRTDSSLL